MNGSQQQERFWGRVIVLRSVRDMSEGKKRDEEAKNCEC